MKLKRRAMMRVSTARAPAIAVLYFLPRLRKPKLGNLATSGARLLPPHRRHERSAAMANPKTFGSDFQRGVRAALDLCRKARDDKSPESWRKEYGDGHRDGADTCC